MERAFPQLLACGMTPEQYWHGDVTLATAYIDAQRLRDERDWWAEWRLGAYFQQAIASAFSKDAQYPDEPMPVTAQREADEERAAQERTEKIKNMAMAWAEMFNSSLGGPEPEDQ